MGRRKKNRTVLQREIDRMKKLHGNGWTIVEIADEVKRDPRTVETHLNLAKLEDSIRPMRRDRHIDRLLKYSDEVRCCLYDPRQWLVPDVKGKVPLTIRRQSYVLDPITWLCLCTPNLAGGQSRMDLESLQEHIKDSKFFEHYDLLKKSVDKLQFNYENAAKTLSLKNKKFKQIWDKIQERMAKNLPLRVPGHVELELDIYPSYSNAPQDLLFLEELEPFIPDVYVQLNALERLLEQLNDDFSQGDIDKLIRVNKCKSCP